MADVMRERKRLREVFVETQRDRDGAGKLRNFDGVGQPVPEMVVQAGAENLRLIFEAAKGASVNNAIAITLELVPIRMRQFGITTPTTQCNGKSEFRERPRRHAGLSCGRDFAESSDGGAADSAA